MLIVWPSAPTARPWPRGTASRGGVGGVVLWDTARRERLQEKPLAVTEGYVQSVAFSPDGKTLAAGYGGVGGGGGVVLWDTARRERLQEKPLAVTEGSVQSVAFSPDGKTLAAGYGVGVGVRRGCGALGHGATRAAPRKAPRRDRGLCS